MMTRRFVRLGVWAAATVFLISQLAACGGGGGGPVADGGMGGTGIVASGAVTAKGSIFVNGIEYSVADATFERDGVLEILTENELSTRIGMVLEVKGTFNADGLTGQATEILFEDVVEGTIDSSVSSSPEVKVLTILAQDVVVEEGLTNFDAPLTFATIEAETGFLEVSGFRREDGLIQATYIELKPAGRFEVVGSVTVIDAASFTIGSLTVTDSGLSLLQTGDLVRVEGTSYSLGTQTLVATSVSLQSPGLSVADEDQAEVEGFVSAGAGPILAGDTFLVDGQNVQFSASTEFVGGTAEDLATNVKIEAEGPLVGGVLLAEKIEFKENLKFQGTVTSVTGNSLTLTYPDDSAGATAIVVTVDPVVTEQETPFAVTDYIKIEGRLLDGGAGSTALATRLRVLSPDTRIILQAPVENFDASTGFIMLLGVSINTDGLLFSEDDAPITQAEFFAVLQSTSEILVKAQGDTDPSPHWTGLELER